MLERQRTVEPGGVLSHVQHLTKILVGLSWRYPRRRFYSNKKFSQQLQFSYKGSLLVPRPFRILYEEFCMGTKDKKDKR